MTFDDVATAVATLAAETNGATPALTPELRARFERAVGWLVFECDELAGPYDAAIEEKFLQIGLSRNLWLRTPRENQLLVEYLYRRGPAGLDDRMLCLALSGTGLDSWFEDTSRAVVQDTEKASRFWKEFEDKSPCLTGAQFRNLYTIPLEELDRLRRN